MTTRTRTTTTTNISSVHHHSKQQHVSSLFLFCSYSLPNPSVCRCFLVGVPFPISFGWEFLPGGPHDLLQW